MEYLMNVLVAVLLAFGMWRISMGLLYRDRYSTGKYGMRRIDRWYKQKRDIWKFPVVKSLLNPLEKIVYLDDTARETLERQIHRAGLNITPEQFTARKYLLYAGAVVAASLCALLKFWYGIIIVGLVAAYGAMQQRESLTVRIAERDEAIAMEMPRFVRTLCRTLQHDRDIYSALASYKKVAGPILGEELNVLLNHMRTGGTAIALQQFQKRIGTDAAFRLCSTLQEIDRGIDQTATLNYLADDMAHQSKLNIQKKLSTRPGRMRLTYLPAVGVCVAMIMYVLIVFVMNQLNNLY